MSGSATLSGTGTNQDFVQLFNMALNSMIEGLCVFDRDGRLIVWNRKYATLYNLTRKKLQPGLKHSAVVDYRISDGMLFTAFGGSFLEYYQGLIVQALPAIVDVNLRDGRSIAINHLPMPDDGWIEIHRDVTEEYKQLDDIKKHESDLVRQNIRLDAAVNNMNQGLCMFDAERRLVICNKPYIDIYELPDVLSLPGTRLEAILDYRVANGVTMVGGSDAYIRGRLEMVNAGIAARSCIEMTDGRALLIQHHPMDDGGWVATHEDITEQRKQEAYTQHLADHDLLTGLANRSKLKSQMKIAEERIARGERLAVMYVDLDQFKVVNDTLGHGFGDKVLVQIGSRLEKCLRSSDFVARFGGDEFIIVTGSLDGIDDVTELAMGVVEAVAKPISIDGRQEFLTASIGIAVAPHDGKNGDTLIKKADLALYRVKNQTKNGFQFFKKGMDAAVTHRRAIMGGLRAAVARNEFRLFFQPQVNLNDQKVRCIEALIRWQHPERGIMSPGDFLQIAEETGIIGQIGEWVLRQACQHAATWPEDIRVAVNL